MSKNKLTIYSDNENDSTGVEFGKNRINWLFPGDTLFVRDRNGTPWLNISVVPGYTSEVKVEGLRAAIEKIRKALDELS